MSSIISTKWNQLKVQSDLVLPDGIQVQLIQDGGKHSRLELRVQGKAVLAVAGSWGFDVYVPTPPAKVKRYMLTGWKVGDKETTVGPFKTESEAKQAKLDLPEEVKIEVLEIDDVEAL